MERLGHSAEILAQTGRLAGGKTEDRSRDRGRELQQVGNAGGGAKGADRTGGMEAVLVVAWVGRLGGFLQQTSIPTWYPAVISEPDKPSRSATATRAASAAQLDASANHKRRLVPWRVGCSRSQEHRDGDAVSKRRKTRAGAYAGTEYRAGGIVAAKS